ncbi:hypothetical protein SAMN04488122_0552 [Chitinophaga arvensicola]|uniref:Uncharacterized protein n=1 Tax=Chitinophaga arvensicola TaxID=29529 RepID=A0A1I0P4V9_9BACT|nr:hypothetical protein SAMN04488122_0552 [Chitinophaga arvensicola]
MGLNKKTGICFDKGVQPEGCASISKTQKKLSEHEKCILTGGHCRFICL